MWYGQSAHAAVASTDSSRSVCVSKWHQIVSNSVFYAQSTTAVTSGRQWHQHKLRQHPPLSTASSRHVFTSWQSGRHVVAQWLVECTTVVVCMSVYQSSLQIHAVFLLWLQLLFLVISERVPLLMVKILFVIHQSFTRIHQSFSWIHQTFSWIHQTFTSIH